MAYAFVLPATERGELALAPVEKRPLRLSVPNGRFRLSPLPKPSRSLQLRQQMGESLTRHGTGAMATSAAKRTAALIKALQKSIAVADPSLDAVTDKDGAIIPDDDLIDFENMPLGTDIRDYMAVEVPPQRAAPSCEWPGLRSTRDPRRAMTNAPASSSPQTSASANGPASSATPR
jgi:hypothetical protein